MLVCAVLGRTSLMSVRRISVLPTETFITNKRYTETGWFKGTRTVVAGKLSLKERVSLAERDLRERAKTLTVHNDAIRLIDLRTTAIEEARRARELIEVRREEREEARDEALKLRLDQIDKSIDNVQIDVKSIRGAGVKLAWIVITLVAAIVVGFAFKGGFTL